MLGYGNEILQKCNGEISFLNAICVFGVSLLQLNSFFIQFNACVWKCVFLRYRIKRISLEEDIRMLKIAICDDNVGYATGLKNQIRALIPGEERVKFREYSRGNDFLFDLSEKREPDVLFLDVQMPDLDGYNIAKKMREQTELTLLVFCSGVAEPTPELFKVDAYRYLLKQYNPQQMRRELREIIDCAVQKKEECYLWGYQRQSHYKIMLEHILYISIAKRGSVIHLINYSYHGENITELNCKLRLSEIYEKIKEAGFEYAHNSYIVNMKYVLRRNSNEIELSDEIILSVSRSKAKTFEKSLCNYCSEMY